MRKVLPISVIIPTFNRFEALSRTLSMIDILSGTIPNEIIIVDQSQREETRRNISYCCDKYRKINAKYILLKTPSSTKARNIGILHAVNDILVFMDDDVDVNKDTFENLYDLMSNPSIAMVGAIDETLPTSGGIMGCLFCMKSFKNRNIGHVTKALLGRYPQTVVGMVDTMWAMGFCFSVKKQYLSIWKLAFDENLTGYAYAEDLDLTFSYYKCAKKLKLKCVLSDKVIVKHLETKEYRTPSKRNIFKYVINRKYLAYKYNEPLSTHLLLKWANVGLMITRIMNHESCREIVEANKRCHQVQKLLKKRIIQEDFFDESFDIRNYQR